METRTAVCSHIFYEDYAESVNWDTGKPQTERVVAVSCREFQLD